MVLISMVRKEKRKNLDNFHHKDPIIYVVTFFRLNDRNLQ